MKINLPLFIFMLLTKLCFGQQKSLLISTHLNTKTGKSVEKVSVVVDKVGTCITGNDGKCFYPTLKGIGMSVSIKASLSDYVPINNLELKSYRLSNQKMDTVQVIMSLVAEREKYALAYFEKETGITIRKRFEQKEKSLYTQIKGLVAKMNDIKDKNNLAYKKLEKNLEEANKRLDLIQKDKLNEESIAQRLATTLSMLEGEEIPDYVSQAYNLFRQGNIKQADNILEKNVIDNEISSAKLMIKIGEFGKQKLKNAIAACLFKAQIKNDLYEFKEAEIWYEKAYKEDTNNASTLFKYAYFLTEQDNPKRPAELYERALQIYESLFKADPEQYLLNMGNTLHNLGIFYSDNGNDALAKDRYERALKIREGLAEKNPEKYLPDLANTLYNLGILYSNNNFDLAKDRYERALKIREGLAEKNPEKYLPDLGSTLNNLGILYSNNNNFDLAKDRYERALKIREGLAEKNPEKYLHDLANTLSGLGLLYKKNDNYGKLTEQWYKNNLVINKRLTEMYPNTSTLATKEAKVSALDNGAWFALFCKEYQLAEDYARKGLAIAPVQNRLYTNLALALLLQNRWAEAKQIYQEKQNLIGNHKKPLKESFLNDLIDLEKEGIRHPDFEKVRALLK